MSQQVHDPSLSPQWLRLLLCGELPYAAGTAKTVFFFGGGGATKFSEKKNFRAVKHTHSNFMDFDECINL